MDKETFSLRANFEYFEFDRITPSAEPISVPEGKENPESYNPNKPRIFHPSEGSGTETSLLYSYENQRSNKFLLFSEGIQWGLFATRWVPRQLAVDVKTAATKKSDGSYEIQEKEVSYQDPQGALSYSGLALQISVLGGIHLLGGELYPVYLFGQFQFGGRVGAPLEVPQGSQKIQDQVFIAEMPSKVNFGVMLPEIRVGKEIFFLMAGRQLVRGAFGTVGAYASSEPNNFQLELGVLLK